MKLISTALARAIDAHTTEAILCLLAMPFLFAYWKTRDQMIGTVLAGIVAGVLAISQKRAGVSVGNVEQANITERKE